MICCCAVLLKRRSGFESQRHRCGWLTCDDPWGNSSCWERDFLFPYSPAPPWGWLRYSSGVFMMMVSKSPIQYGCTPNTSVHTQAHTHRQDGTSECEVWGSYHCLCEKETVRGCSTATGQCQWRWHGQWVGLAETQRARALLGSPGPFERDESVNAMQMAGSLWPSSLPSLLIVVTVCLFICAVNSPVYTTLCRRCDWWNSSRSQPYWCCGLARFGLWSPSHDSSRCPLWPQRWESGWH